MNAVPCDADALVALIATARAQCRVVGDDLIRTVVPSLPSDRRTFPQDMAKVLARGNVHEEGFLRDLDALNDLVRATVAAGTHRVWLADEHHVAGGYDSVMRSQDIADLAAAAERLSQLRVAIANVVDMRRALRDAENLHNA